MKPGGFPGDLELASQLVDARCADVALDEGIDFVRWQFVVRVLQSCRNVGFDTGVHSGAPSVSIGDDGPVSVPGEVQPGHQRWLPSGQADKTPPAWLQPHAGEQRWLALTVVVLAIVLQLLLPHGFVVQPRLVAPIIEALLCIVLVVANPGRMVRPLVWLRYLSLGLIGFLAATNTVLTILLVRVIVTGAHISAVGILAGGAGVWLTNVIAYALLFWEFDRGGPVDRALTPRPTPDFCSRR